MPFAALLVQLPQLVRHAIPAEWVAAFSFATMVTMLLFVIFGLRRLTQRRAEPGAVRADAAGVHWNGALVAPREKVRAGVLVPKSPSQTDQSAARVRIARKFGMPLEFGVASDDEGRAFLRALGLDSSQVTATFHARSRFAVSTGAMTLAMTAFVVATTMIAVLTRTHAPIALMMLPFFAVAMLAVIPTSAVVGTDGVLVKWMGTRRFIAYRDIARLDRTDTGVQIVLHDGSTTPVNFWTQRGTKTRLEIARMERDAFVTRLQQARDASPTPETRVDPGTVSRGTRSAAEWLDALRALTRAEGGMRTAPIVRDQLFDLINDARLDASARAGAAAAIGLDGVEVERERLRVTAATIAQPKLRVVLEAAAKGDETALREALEDVKEESATSRVA